ncbi:Similar to atk: Protein artichoke (Drosophila melanogaster) [Cotesia congregata]|uniref:Similar to atk: Protein artichoke (Drosophila melanogaster) n=1 Tax=Cotesia congregata TaxID=51543 RepID=A0A8J2HEB1_COTCN|nr:Similar to atk: Protein artichoke (Drosophila melanogaster) [Cotesia congregata]
MKARDIYSTVAILSLIGGVVSQSVNDDPQVTLSIQEDHQDHQKASALLQDQGQDVPASQIGKSSDKGEGIRRFDAEIEDKSDAKLTNLSIDDRVKREPLSESDTRDNDNHSRVHQTPELIPVKVDQVLQSEVNYARKSLLVDEDEVRNERSDKEKINIDEIPASDIQHWKEQAVLLQEQIKNESYLSYLREAEILPGVPKFTEIQVLDLLKKVAPKKLDESYFDKANTSALSKEQLEALKCAEGFVKENQRKGFADDMLECIRGLNFMNCMRIFIWPIIVDNVPESITQRFPTLPLEFSLSDFLPVNRETPKIVRATAGAPQQRLISPELVISNILKDALEGGNLKDYEKIPTYIDEKNETFAQILTPGQLEILQLAEKFLPESLRQDYANRMYSCVTRFEYFSCIKFFTWPMIKQNFPALPEFPDYQSWYPASMNVFPGYPLIPFPENPSKDGELPEVVEAEFKNRRPRPETLIVHILKNTLDQQPRQQLLSSAVRLQDDNIKAMTKEQLASIQMAEQLIPIEHRAEFVNTNVDCMRQFNYLTCLRYVTWPTVRKWKPNMPNWSELFGQFAQFGIPDFSSTPSSTTITIPTYPIWFPGGGGSIGGLEGGAIGGSISSGIGGSGASSGGNGGSNHGGAAAGGGSGASGGSNQGGTIVGGGSGGSGGSHQGAAIAGGGNGGSGSGGSGGSHQGSWGQGGSWNGGSGSSGTGGTSGGSGGSAVNIIEGNNQGVTAQPGNGGIIIIIPGQSGGSGSSSGSSNTGSSGVSSGSNWASGSHHQTSGGTTGGTSGSHWGSGGGGSGGQTGSGSSGGQGSGGSGISGGSGTGGSGGSGGISGGSWESSHGGSNVGQGGSTSGGSGGISGGSWEISHGGSTAGQGGSTSGGSGGSGGNQGGGVTIIIPPGGSGGHHHGSGIHHGTGGSAGSGGQGSHGSNHESSGGNWGSSGGSIGGSGISGGSGGNQGPSGGNWGSSGGSIGGSGVSGGSGDHQGSSGGGIDISGESSGGSHESGGDGSISGSGGDQGTSGGSESGGDINVGGSGDGQGSGGGSEIDQGSDGGIDAGGSAGGDGGNQGGSEGECTCCPTRSTNTRDSIQYLKGIEPKIIDILHGLRYSMINSPIHRTFIADRQMMSQTRLTNEQLTILELSESMVPFSARRDLISRSLGCLQGGADFMVCTKNVIWPFLQLYIENIPEFPANTEASAINNYKFQSAGEKHGLFARKSQQPITNRRISSSQGNFGLLRYPNIQIAARTPLQSGISAKSDDQPIISVTGTRFVPIYSDHPEGIILNILNAMAKSKPEAQEFSSKIANFPELLSPANQQQESILKLSESLLPENARTSFFENMLTCLRSNEFVVCSRDIMWPQLIEYYPRMPSFPAFQRILNSGAAGDYLQPIADNAAPIAETNVKTDLAGDAMITITDTQFVPISERPEEVLLKLLKSMEASTQNPSYSSIAKSPAFGTQFTKSQSDVLVTAENLLPPTFREVFIIRMSDCTRGNSFLDCMRDISWPTLGQFYSRLPSFPNIGTEVNLPAEKPQQSALLPPHVEPNYAEQVPERIEFLPLSQYQPNNFQPFGLNPYTEEYLGLQQQASTSSVAFAEQPKTLLDISQENTLQNLTRLRRNIDNQSNVNLTETDFIELLNKILEKNPETDPKKPFVETLNSTVKDLLTDNQLKILNMTERLGVYNTRGVMGQVINCITGLSFIRCLGIFMVPVIMNMLPSLGLGLPFGRSNSDNEDNLMKSKESVENLLLDWYKSLTQEKFSTFFGLLEFQGYGNGEIGVKLSGFRQARARIKDHKNLPSILTIISDIMEDVLDPKPENVKVKKIKRQRSLELNSFDEVNSDDRIIQMLLERLKANNSNVDGDANNKKKKMLMIQLVLLGLVLPIRGGYIPPGPRYTCPKDHFYIYPCECLRGSDSGLFIRCENTNLASLSLAFANLGNEAAPIEELTLYKCNIARFYGPALYPLDVRVIRIIDTPLKSIEEHSFLGVNRTLQELYIERTELERFPREALQILGNLSIMKIKGNKLTSLPGNSFSGSMLAGKLEKLEISDGLLSLLPADALIPLKKLKHLDLHGNKIGELKRNQFKGLRDTEVLDLSHNLISKLDPSHLADLTKMGSCNLSHNAIGELKRGTFARNTVLKVLNLRSNKIRKLDSNTFRGMRFLRRLYLSDNQINDVGRGTFGSITRIGTIDLARNQIKRIDYQMFNQLQFSDLIDVSENQVTVIEKLAFKDLFLTQINLSRNAIEKIEPGAFENCANITLLDLSYNKLENIAKTAFDSATYATELQISYNLLTELNQVPLQNMTGLKVLNVSHNNIHSIPRQTFPKLYELHTIDISYNNLSEIHSAIFQTLFSLRFLNMSHNSLEKIKPATFGSLPTVLELDLSYNKLKDIARGSLAKLASCRILTVKNNHLEKIFQLPISLGHLDFSENELSEIPSEDVWPPMNSLLSLDLSHNRLGDNLQYKSFDPLLTLRTLNLENNNMTRPPWAALSTLTSLQYLYMQDNQLTQLDKASFGQLPIVFELNLANNRIKTISPRAFEGLLQLLTLNLTGNNLTHIPNGAFQGLVSLRSLDLSKNRLEKLDNKTHGVLEDCLSLERINLSNNKISFITRKTFPSDPYRPYRLKQIDLSYNSMPVVTFDLTTGTKKVEALNLSHNDVIGNLTSLKTLDLSDNELSDLSEEFVFEPPENLTNLYLSGNHFSQLPVSKILAMPNLKVLDLKNNELGSFDESYMKIVRNKTSVRYGGNPLHCDCYARPVRRWLETLTEIPDEWMDLTCASPDYVANKRLVDVAEDLMTSGNKPLLEKDLVYKERSFKIKNLPESMNIKYELCVLARDSIGNVKHFRSSQCQILNKRPILSSDSSALTCYFTLTLVTITLIAVIY